MDLELKLKLRRAIKNNDITTVRSLVAGGEKQLLCELEHNGFGPLHVAAYMGHWEMVRFLCETPFYLIDKATPLGQTALLISASRGFVNIVQYLIAQGADVNAAACLPEYSYKEISAIQLATEKGHHEVVDILLTAKADTLSMIHIAAREGYRTLVERYLTHDFNLLDQLSEEKSPIFWAATKGHIDIVRDLISKGANLNLPMNVILHSATEKGSEEIVLILLKAGAVRTVVAGQHLIHFASQYGLMETVKFFLEEEPRLLNQVDNLGQTPILWAASRGHTQLVAYFISLGADLNQTTKETIFGQGGYAALHWAIRNGHCKTTEILMKAEANVFPVKGMNILHIAASTGQLELVKFLFEGYYQKNQNILNQLTSLHETPLFLAASEGYVEVVTYLLYEGADFNLATNQNKTPLKIALEKAHFRVANLLLLKMRLNDETQNALIEESEALFNSNCPQILHKRADRRISFFSTNNNNTGFSDGYIECEPANKFISEIQDVTVLHKLVMRLAEALFKLHTKDIIPHEIKLENILISVDSSDFIVNYIVLGMTESLHQDNPTLTLNSPDYPSVRNQSNPCSFVLEKNTNIFSFAHMLKNFLITHQLGSELVELFPSIIQFIQSVLEPLLENRPSLERFVNELLLEYTNYQNIEDQKSNFDEKESCFMEEDWVDVENRIAR